MVEVKAYAKINLTLDIVGRRENGYHDVDMIMQTVSLYDKISVTVNENESEFLLTCNKENIPTDSSNTAFKAAKLYLEHIGKTCGAIINIEKNIPSQAGLAGGSADGAGVLYALNHYFNNEVPTNEMLTLCSKIGADVPFCYIGGTKLATGIGTTLSHIKNITNFYMVIVKPQINVSTKIAYEKADIRGYKNTFIHSKKMLNYIYNNDVKAIASNLYNDFESIMNLKEVEEVKNIMVNNNSLGACMSGSGSAIYGIFESKQECIECKEVLQNMYNEVFVAHTVNYGCKIVE